ncbi:response regulator [candidate division KSB1 bacterium]|nr:response regulator [candidate division KSB1 bacterium]
MNERAAGFPQPQITTDQGQPPMSDIRRLLVVDDEEVICQIVDGFLSHDQWTVESARTIAQARGLLADREYSVILCDVHLEGDPLEFLAEVREQRPDAQLIMFTGDPSVDSVREALAIGAYDYMTKPCRRDELTRTVQRAFEKHLLLRRQSGLLKENEAYRTALEQMLEQRSHQLRESERRYRALFDSAVDCIFVVSVAEGAIVDANIAAAHLLGMSRPDVIGRQLSEFVGAQFDPLLAEAATSAVAEWRQDRVAVAGPSNRRRTAQVSCGRVLIDGQSCVQIVARDLTDHLELIERNELMELELLSEQRLAAIGLLASGVAHNINTPLMGIYGVAQLIKMKHPEIEDIDGVITQVDRITSIIRNLMWKSRQEQDSAYQEIDLCQLLREELRFLEADLDFKHYVDKQYSLSTDLPAIYGRYSDFSQSLMNVVRNALDAMHGRDARVLKVAAAVRDGEILISIQDSGCGISAEDRDKIFMPFFTTKLIVGSDGGPTGTGLGLSTVQKLMSPYGVRFEIESQPNQGTTFVFRIPTEINSPRRARDRAKP